MTSNVNGTSIMIHMRLTVCRLDTCATSGRCYTSDFQFYKVFYLITVMLFVQIEPLLNMMVVVSDDESLPELKYL